MFVPLNKSYGGQKVKQPMGKRVVTVSDIFGRTGGWGVTETQEIIFPPFIFHITDISSSLQSFVNAARTCKELLW